MNKINFLFYAIVGLLSGYFFYQYGEHSLYVGGIVLSFLALNGLVMYYYSTFRQSSTAIMKFMAINFSKDVIWAFFWVYLLNRNPELTLFLGAVFLLLSIPLYISVIRGMKK